MRIRRSRLTADYVQVPNRTARDDRLSYMARGILVELLSRPDGWEATADDLWRLATQARGAGESRRAMRAAFAELKNAGYLVSTREKLGGGRFGTVLTLYDVSAGRTDVPTVGTSETSTGVPTGGTSEPPGKTDVPAGRTDVPTGGSPEPPGEAGISAGRTDVPTVGTSSKKTGLKKGENSSRARAVRDLVDRLHCTEQEAREIIKRIKDTNGIHSSLTGYIRAMSVADLSRYRPTPIPPDVGQVLTDRRNGHLGPVGIDLAALKRDLEAKAARARIGTGQGGDAA
jgi:hypothetical protein